MPSQRPPTIASPWIQIRVLRCHPEEGQMYCPPQHSGNWSRRHHQPHDHMFVHPPQPAGHVWRYYPRHPSWCIPSQEGGTACWANQSVWDIWRIQGGIQGKIILACDEAYLVTIKNDIFGFSERTVTQMLDHLEQQCLTQTEQDKKIKRNNVNLPCDRDENIETNFVKANKLKEYSQENYGIE